MTNEPVFVAIGISCVVAVLLFIVFIIYCVKKQQEKEQTRLMRQRRAREERHRRHLMGANIVRPPPYDPHRQNTNPVNASQIPVSPPPEYKEIATPLPRNRNEQDFNDTLDTPPYYSYFSESDNIQTISRNVAPVNTALAGNYYTNNSSSLPSNNGRYVNRTTITTAISNQINDNTFQVRPLSGAAEIIEHTSRSLNSDRANVGFSEMRNNKPSPSYKHLYPYTSPRQALDVTALAQQQTNHGESNIYNSSNHSERRRPVLNSTNHENDRYQPHNYTETTSLSGLPRDGNNNSTSYSLSGSYGGTSTARISRNVIDIEVAPIHNYNSDYQSGWNSSNRSTNHPGQNEEWISGFEELSLI